jgi:uncharacterized membrane protein YgaE (UPF0421/DUF939 family)
MHKNIWIGLLVIGVIGVVYYITQDSKQYKKKESKMDSKVESIVESKVESIIETVKEEPSYPEPLEEGFFENFANSEFTSDVRDVNNKNYQNYVFGGKIEK